MENSCYIPSLAQLAQSLPERLYSAFIRRRFSEMFAAVLDQRTLVDQANAKIKAARRSVQRRNDAVKATIDKAKNARDAVDYSKPVKPAESELWDD